MTTSTSCWEKIPLLNSENPEQSFDITSDVVSGAIYKKSEISRKNK